MTLSTVERLTRELEAMKTRAKLAEARAERAASRMTKVIERNQALVDEVKALQAEMKKQGRHDYTVTRQQAEIDNLRERLNAIAEMARAK